MAENSFWEFTRHESPISQSPGCLDFSFLLLWQKPCGLGPLDWSPAWTFWVRARLGGLSDFKIWENLLPSCGIISRCNFESKPQGPQSDLANCRGQEPQKWRGPALCEAASLIAYRILSFRPLQFRFLRGVRPLALAFFGPQWRLWVRQARDCASSGCGKQVSWCESSFAGSKDNACPAPRRCGALCEFVVLYRPLPAS